MIKAILVNDNQVSSQVGYILGTSRESIVNYVKNQAEKHCNEQGYIITKDNNYKFEVKFVDSHDSELITTYTVHFNTMQTLMVN